MMQVWIIERNHKPMTFTPWFPLNQTGAMKSFLNRLHADDDNYFDGVLYERIEPGEKK